MVYWEFKHYITNGINQDKPAPPEPPHPNLHCKVDYEYFHFLALFRGVARPSLCWSEHILRKKDEYTYIQGRSLFYRKICPLLPF